MANIWEEEVNENPRGVKELHGEVSDFSVLKDIDSMYYVGQLKYHANYDTWFSNPTDSAGTKYQRYSQAMTALTLQKKQA